MGVDRALALGNLVRNRRAGAVVDGWGPLMARRYRGVGKSYLRGKSRSYACPSRSQHESLTARPRQVPEPREGFRSSRESRLTMSDASTVAKEKLSRRVTLSRRASFWATAAFAVLAFAANTAASPLYRVYENEFRFSPTTLTLLFTVYIVVLLVTLLLFGSVSDYSGRRMMLLAGLAFGAGGCGLFLIAHGVGLLFAARALQGVAVGLISGAASAALLDLRPESGITPVVSSAAPTGGQALGAIGASALAQTLPPRPTWCGGCYSGPSSAAWSPSWRCQSQEQYAPVL